MKDTKIWELGDKHCVTNGEGPRGRGDLQIFEIEECNLNVVRDDSPPRHAEIRGFAEKVEDQVDMAKLLAEKCTLIIRENA
jgi:hypothetical protein